MYMRIKNRGLIMGVLVFAVYWLWLSLPVDFANKRCSLQEASQPASLGCHERVGCNEGERIEQLEAEAKARKPAPVSRLCQLRGVNAGNANSGWSQWRRSPTSRQ